MMAYIAFQRTISDSKLNYEQNLNYFIMNEKTSLEDIRAPPKKLYLNNSNGSREDNRELL